MWGRHEGQSMQAATHQLQELLLLRDTAKKLRKLGFAASDNSTALTLAVLFNAGIFNRGAVLVGTHAYGALLNSLGAHIIPSPLTMERLADGAER